TIVEVDGKAVVNLSQIRHIIGTKYEGDPVTLKVKRGNDMMPLTFDLVSTKTQYAHPFLGILPMRDAPELGVQVRYAYPKSPSDRAGLKEGDRIVKIGLGGKPLEGFTGEKRGRLQMMEWLNTAKPGVEIKLEVVRKAGGKTDTLTAKLDSMPGTALTR